MIVVMPVTFPAQVRLCPPASGAGDWSCSLGGPGFPTPVPAPSPLSPSSSLRPRDLHPIPFTMSSSPSRAPPSPHPRHHHGFWSCVRRAWTVPSPGDTVTGLCKSAVAAGCTEDPTGGWGECRPQPLHVAISWKHRARRESGAWGLVTCTPSPVATWVAGPSAGPVLGRS